MSYCMVLAWGGDAKDVEFPNASGFGAMIWGAVQRHIGWSGADWLIKGMGKNGFLGEEFWSIYQDRKVPEDERIALVLTFDRVYVPVHHVPRVALALRNFEEAHRQANHVCHLAGMARAMEEAVECGATAIGFYGHSVGDNPWVEPVYDGSGDEDGDFRELAPGDEGTTSIAKFLPDIFEAMTVDWGRVEIYQLPEGER